MLCVQAEYTVHRINLRALFPRLLHLCLRPLLVLLDLLLAQHYVGHGDGRGHPVRGLLVAGLAQQGQQGQLQCMREETHPVGALHEHLRVYAPLPRLEAVRVQRSRLCNRHVREERLAYALELRVLHMRAGCCECAVGLAPASCGVGRLRCERPHRGGLEHEPYGRCALYLVRVQLLHHQAQPHEDIDVRGLGGAQQRGVRHCRLEGRVLLLRGHLRLRYWGGLGLWRGVSDTAWSVLCSLGILGQVGSHSRSEWAARRAATACHGHAGRGVAAALLLAHQLLHCVYVHVRGAHLERVDRIHCVRYVRRERPHEDKPHSLLGSNDVDPYGVQHNLILRFHVDICAVLHRRAELFPQQGSADGQQHREAVHDEVHPILPIRLVQQRPKDKRLGVLLAQAAHAVVQSPAVLVRSHQQFR
mmetsp:Transcript_14882/g.32842  ORF Transcript_14882/g.32842 Transcript_14882/m.32842 type:complete len:417 (+) Transcript_14882:2493-3743(+)